MFIEDVYQWNFIDTSNVADTDSAAMFFVASEVNKYIEMCDDDPSLEYPLTLEQWTEMLGEELAFQKSEDPGFWGFDDDSIYDSVCGKVDAYLPYYLENNGAAADYIAW